MPGFQQFSNGAGHDAAKQTEYGRHPLEVVRRDPEIIIGSWCGKHFRSEHISRRPGWSAVTAVQNGQMHEIKSAIILTPGPVAISEGLPLLLDIFDL